ncbi:MAG: hypothetical protein KDA45_03520 [Planctomycetales bacterium]|nr:hypothetical protein [Planctomycetales bacterium]
MAKSNGSELASESTLLMRRATWCGIVFALAVLLTALNFVPPIHVHYRVRSQVVVSASRLGQLREQAIADREAVRSGQLKAAQLMTVKVLDQADQDSKVEGLKKSGNVLLVQIDSLWLDRSTPQEHYDWLRAVTQIDARQVADDGLARQARLARWELQAAQHYQRRHEFLKDKLPLAAEEVASDQRGTFELASYSTPLSPSAEKTGEGSTRLVSHTASPESSATLERQLREQLQRAEQNSQRSELAWQKRLEQSSGVLQLASVPVQEPRSTSIPLWMVASILILGLAAGSTAGWLQMRLQSGGAYEATFVAERLALDGIPVVGKIELPGDPASRADWLEATSRRASQVGRQTARRLTQLGEGALAFWVVLMAARFLLDSIWRDVLLASPLAALGRLMSGMP